MKHLIVVDYQRDFVTGALGSERAQEIYPTIARRIQKRAAEGWNIIFTLDTHDPQTYSESQEGKNLPIPHCYRGTEGWHLYNDIYEVAKKAVKSYKQQHGVKEDDENDDVLLVEKGTFGYHEWKFMLSGAEEIEILGVCTDICVVSNALILKAAFPEIPISVVANGCAGTSDVAHNNALSVMRSCQIEILNEEEV